MVISRTASLNSMYRAAENHTISKIECFFHCMHSMFLVQRCILDLFFLLLHFSIIYLFISSACFAGRKTLCTNNGRNDLRSLLSVNYCLFY